MMMRVDGRESEKEEVENEEKNAMNERRTAKE
jgi:hypothetical protein